MVVGDIAQGTDVLVIGAGPGGYTAAIRAAQLGKDVILVEKDELGGLCLNYGCIPSKALIHAADTYELIEETKIMGIELAGMKVDAPKMQEWRKKIILTLKNGISALCKRNGVEVMKGEAFFEGPKKVGVKTATGLSFIEFQKAVLATGSVPKQLKGLEFDGKQIISSKEALEFEKVPQSIAVVGGGYIGVELGTMYAKLGSKLTLIEALPRILPNSDDDVALVVRKRLNEFKATVLEGTKVIGVEKRSDKVVLKVEKNGGVSSVEAEKVLVAIGHRPVTDGLRLEKTGVQLDERGFVKVNEQLRTTDQNIYAIGDIAGGYMLAHKAYRQGKVVAEVIAGLPSAFDNKVVPAVIFSDPEIASVGLNEKEARIQFSDCLVGKFPLMASGRALTMNKADGFGKVIAKADTHELLGVHIVGPNASDLIGEASLAMEMGARLEDIASTIHPHPTLSEVLSEAAEAALGKAIHSYNKKKE